MSQIHIRTLERSNLASKLFPVPLQYVHEYIHTQPETLKIEFFLYVLQLHLLHVHTHNPLLESKQATYRLPIALLNYVKCVLYKGTRATVSPRTQQPWRSCCGRCVIKSELSGRAAPLSGCGSPQHHFLLLIALTLSLKHGHRTTYVAHLGFFLISRTKILKNLNRGF